MQMSVSTAVQVYLGVVNKLIVMGNVVGLPCLKLLQIPCLVRSLKVEFVNSIIRLNTTLRCLTDRVVRAFTEGQAGMPN